MDEEPRRLDLPGRPTSPWLDGAEAAYPSLTTDRRVDVAVVGAGIAGLSTAIQLRDRGYAVAVIERDFVGSGITGKSTAKLTSQHGRIYAHLWDRFGSEAAREYADRNESAIDAVERRIEDEDIDCPFERTASYCYGDDRDAIEREVAAATAAGIDARFVTSIPPFDRAEAGIRFDDQAWFDPRAYLLGLAEMIDERSLTAVYEGTRVTDVEPGTPCRLRTVTTGSGDAEAATVTADAVVVATGYPLYDRAGFAMRMHPKRSYVLALRVEGRLPTAMYYGLGEPYRSVRPHRDGAGSLLLVGGENHKTGQGGSTADRYRRLLGWARERFPVESVAYRWSTQDYVSADGVPFVGRAGLGSETVYVATGFGGWGMTNGVAAGGLLAELIDGEEPAAAALFDPFRVTPRAATAKTLTENADAAAQFATDWVRTLVDPVDPVLNPGEGRVVRRGGSPVALSRDAGGDLHAVSAVCTHARCLVSWNDAEASWDCPCHGSRFTSDGSVLEGPATEPLASKDDAGR